VSGNSLVQAKGDNNAIYGYKKVEIKDHAQVISEDACAISQQSPSIFTLSITGGMVFAYGSSIEQVINQANSINFSGVDGSGIILAWNKEAGKTI
jgi:urocanate hydratase